MGVLSVGGNNVAQFTGLQYSTVANLTIIASLTACRDRTLKSGAAA